MDDDFFDEIDLVAELEQTQREEESADIRRSVVVSQTQPGSSSQPSSVSWPATPVQLEVLGNTRIPSQETPSSEIRISLGSPSQFKADAHPIRPMDASTLTTGHIPGPAGKFKRMSEVAKTDILRMDKAKLKKKYSKALNRRQEASSGNSEEVRLHSGEFRQLRQSIPPSLPLQSIKDVSENQDKLKFNMLLRIAEITHGDVGCSVRVEDETGKQPHEPFIKGSMIALLHSKVLSMHSIRVDDFILVKEASVLRLSVQQFLVIVPETISQYIATQANINEPQIIAEFTEDTFGLPSDEHVNENANPNVPEVHPVADKTDIRKDDIEFDDMLEEDLLLDGLDENFDF